MKYYNTSNWSRIKFCEAIALEKAKANDVDGAFEACQIMQKLDPNSKSTLGCGGLIENVAKYFMDQGKDKIANTFINGIVNPVAQQNARYKLIKCRDSSYGSY